MASQGFVEVEIPGFGTVEFPDGMSRDDMAAAIKRLPGLPAPPPTPMEQAGGALKQAGVGAAKTIVNNAGLGGDLREAAGGFADWLASKFQKPKTGGLSDAITGGEGGPSVAPAPFNERFTGKAAPTAGETVKRGLMAMPGLGGAFFSLPTSADVKKGVESVTGEFRKPQNVGEEYTQTIGEFLPALVVGPGQIAGNTARQTMANILKEGPKRLATNAVAPGLASEAAGQSVRKTAPQAEPYVRFAASLTPAALLSAGQAAWRGVRKPNIPPERQEAADRLRAEGVDKLSPGEIIGDTQRRYNEAGAGMRAQAMEEQKLRQLTAAAVRRFGETGERFDEALASGRARIGPGIEEAAGRLMVRMDPELGDALVKIDKLVFKEGLNPDQVNRLRAVRDHVVENFETVARKSKAKNAADLADWTEMKGPAFQNIIAKDSILQGAIDEGGRIGFYAKKMKEALMDAAERTAHRQGTGQKKIDPVTGVAEETGSRKAFEDFKQLRRQYANMKAMEEGASAGGPDAARGLLTPASVRMIATNRDKADYFLGRNDYAQLAKDANTMFYPLPNSGTAQRMKGNLLSQLIGALVGGVVGGPVPNIGAGLGSAVGAVAAPSVVGRTRRLTPWWLDQEIANRRHLASLLQSDIATQKLLQGPEK